MPIKKGRRGLCDPGVPCAKDCIGQISNISQERFTPTTVRRAVKIREQCYDREGLERWLRQNRTLPHDPSREITDEEIETWGLDVPTNERLRGQQELDEDEEPRFRRFRFTLDDINYWNSLHGYGRPLDRDPPRLVIARFHYANMHPERRLEISQGEEDEAALAYYETLGRGPIGGGKKVKSKKMKQRRKKTKRTRRRK